MALLEVENLQTHFRTPDGVIRAVDGISFAVEAGETVAIVGESGCGKSVTANSILRLVPQPPGKIGGAIRFQGRDLLKLSERAMREVRGNDISMIFQEPMTSLNPVLTIGRQIAEPLRLHQGLSREGVEKRVVEMLGLVGIAEPRRRAREYPHQLSGGMRQRVMIAIALACRPKLLIADEPTTALDVTIQAQILNLMTDLKQRVGAAIILITHDLGVVAEIAERVMVMYAGRKVEEAPVAELFRSPRHPYTRAAAHSPVTCVGTWRPRWRRRRRRISRPATSPPGQRWPHEPGPTRSQRSQEAFPAARQLAATRRPSGLRGRRHVGGLAAAAAAAHAGRVPGSAFEPQSAHARARSPRRADPQLRPGQINRRYGGPDRPAAGKSEVAARGQDALAARILRRTAPAHRHRARARGRARPCGVRRGGLRAGRFRQGADRQPAAGPAARVRPCAPLHQS